MVTFVDKVCEVKKTESQNDGNDVRKRNRKMIADHLPSQVASRIIALKANRAGSLQDRVTRWHWKFFSLLLIKVGQVNCWGRSKKVVTF